MNLSYAKFELYYFFIIIINQYCILALKCFSNLNNMTIETIFIVTMICGEFLIDTVYQSYIDIEFIRDLQCWNVKYFIQQKNEKEEVDDGQDASGILHLE